MPYDPERHGPRRVVGPGFHREVYRLVERVPAGRVTTYGDVAAALGLRSVARQVGFALAALPLERKDVPWHRVINSRGSLSARASGAPHRKQLKLLRQEGIRVDINGRVEEFAALRYRFGDDQDEPAG